MEDAFVNKVAESGLLTIDLEEYLPLDEIAVFDIKEYLFMGLILKEKDFREALKHLDVTSFINKTVALTCTTDAVIPMWAYMLAASYLQPVAKEIYFSSVADLEQSQLIKNINAINIKDYLDKRVVIKGCGDKHISEAAYVAITQKLLPVVKSIMYGEPCSTVPVYKKK
jgi:hypothetical protein